MPIQAAVILSANSVKLGQNPTWQPDPAINGVTSYTIDKTADGTITWANVATITYSLNGPNYDKINKLFFYQDGSQAVGNIYRITAVGTYGTSVYAYVIVAPAPPAMCRLIGYQLTPFASVDMDAQIQVQAYGGTAPWYPGGAGTLGQEKSAVGIQNGRKIVYPDCNGIWQTDVMQGTACLVLIPTLKFAKAFTVPAKAGPINIQDVQSLRGADFFSVVGNPVSVPTDIISTGG